MPAVGSNRLMVKPSRPPVRRPASRAGVVPAMRASVSRRGARVDAGAADSGRAYGGLSPQDRASARRQRLLDAATTLFGNQGLRATTVRGVCNAAGLTDRYFYESFASLEALLAAVYLRLLARLRAALAQAAGQVPATAGTAARFTAGYGAWFDFVRHPGHARILLAEVLGVSPAVDALYEGGMAEFADALAAPLADAGASPERCALVARALVGAVVQVAKMWLSSGYQAPRDVVVGSCVLVAVGTVQALRQAALGR